MLLIRSSAVRGIADDDSLTMMVEDKTEFSVHR
jgi:hypothetical protein